MTPLDKAEPPITHRMAEEENDIESSKLKLEQMEKRIERKR